jgi:adenine C2-methylase RlmN of 23S rRNA A2503 and tRNA A37
MAALKRAGAEATLRREKGMDIEAACGQLRLKVSREEGVHSAPNSVLAGNE